MTQAEFDRMPRVMKPSQVAETLGLDLRAVRKLRRAAPEVATVLPGQKHFGFIKSKIAELAQLEYH